MEKVTGFMGVLKLNHSMFSPSYCGYKLVNERGDLVVTRDRQMHLQGRRHQEPSWGDAEYHGGCPESMPGCITARRKPAVLKRSQEQSVRDLSSLRSCRMLTTFAGPVQSKE
jgi:hypothetical protein